MARSNSTNTILTVAMIGSKGIPALSGGVEQHVQYLSTRLAGLGVRVVVYTRSWYTRSAKRSFNGVELVPLPSLRTKHGDTITHTILAVLHALWSGVDIIHLHGIGPALVLPLIRLVSSTRVVVTYHSPDYYHQKWGVVARTMLRLGERMSCRFAHELIVVSKELERHIWSVYRRKAVFIPNGAQLPAHAALSPQGKCALRRMGLTKGYILYVGRLVRHKGVHTLIEAWKCLEGDVPELVIVGSGHHTQSYCRELRALARGSSGIHFVGERKGAELGALYQGARLVAQPSESEGMSLVLLEAMSYAKPVVASDIVENREVLDAPEFTFRSRDANDLVRVLRYVMSQPERALEQGRANRRQIREWYQWKRVGDATNRLYMELLATPMRFRFAAVAG